MTNMFRIGERLVWLRENSGYSQEALAERLGCCAITISRWENGHTPMKVMDIVKIVDILDASADFLLDIETSVEDSDYMVGLNQKQQRIVLHTLKALSESPKLEQDI